MAQDEIHDFRYLRGRLIKLQQMAYRNRQMVQNVDWGKQAGRDNSADLQRLRLENDAIEGEMSEIEFGLEFYRRKMFEDGKMTITKSTLLLATALVVGIFLALLLIGAFASGAFHVG